MATIQVPSPLEPSAIEGLKNDPQLYNVLNTIITKFNATLDFNTVVADIQAMPTGPRSVSASQIGGTVQLNFGSDLGPSPIDSYVVWRADAGTRNAPTSPVFSAATPVATIQSNSAACLIGTNYATGTYTWIDRNFTIAELDPANPARKSYWVSSIDNQARPSFPVQATATPVETITNGGGDQTPDTPLSIGNMFFNPRFGSGATTTNVSLPFFNADNAETINAVANTTPIGITTVANHPFVTGDSIVAVGALVNVVNGYYNVTKTGANTLTLDGTTAAGAAGAGGFLCYATGSGKTPNYDSPPVPPSSGLAIADYAPWVTTFFAAGDHAEYVSDGTQQTGEVRLKAPTAGNFTDLRQFIRANKMPNGPNVRLVISVFARCPVQPTNSEFQIGFSVNSGTGVFSVSQPFSATLLTTTYQRFAFACLLGAGFSAAADTFVVGFTNHNISGTGKDIFITRPMLNIGSYPGSFTISPQGGDTPGAITSANNDFVINPSRPVLTTIKRNYTYP